MRFNLKSKGFTLIEILIVVAIVAILAAIAFPSYQNSVWSSRRADAQALLLRVAQTQERHFTQFSQYAANLGPAAGGGAGPNFLGLQANQLTSDSGFYTVGIAGNPFTLTATPNIADPICGNLTLTQIGVRGFTDNVNGTPQLCL